MSSGDRPKAGAEPARRLSVGWRRLMVGVAPSETIEPVAVDVAATDGTGEASLDELLGGVPSLELGEGPPSHSTPSPSRASVPPPVNPEQLWSGKIRVTGEIDRGGMGYVMRGTDTTLQRELALKVAPLPRKELPRAQLARFIEEAQITAQLEHPNVVPVHEIGLDPEGRFYFSMKLVRGRSLEAILEQRKQGDAKTLTEFGLRRLLDVFLKVCQAIEYAHARGVIHRDLKPANIMVGDFGEVLVMDWGVAKVHGREELPIAQNIPAARRDSLPPLEGVASVRKGKRELATQLGEVVGTPEYMSPEQAQGRPVDARTDIYALGVILYEILCGEVPFDDPDAARTLARLLSETPRRPSKLNRTTPLALERLCLALLEKNPERRTVTIPQIRTYIDNYLEGIGHDYRREGVWSNVLWLIGALSVFAFVVWYLTGQSVARLFVVAPPTVLNAVGWFLLIVAVGYPLWSAYVGMQLVRSEHDRFRPATSDEIFVSGYLAHRTFAAALAPLFQLIFLVELVAFAIVEASRGRARSGEVVHQITTQLRTEWAQSLLVIMSFLFAYLFLLSTEARFARRIDRYQHMVRRPRWEPVWPFFLIIVLLLTIGTTGSLDWALLHPGEPAMEFVIQQLYLTVRLDPFEIVKTLVFQGTFLMGLVSATIMLSFPFPEVLAALKLAYEPADEAAVAKRSEYFLRSMAIFRVARMNWLYGGAMIGSLTALSVLSQSTSPTVSSPLIEQLLYVLTPSVIGFAGYAITRRHVRRFLANAPAVSSMIEAEVARGKSEQADVKMEWLSSAPWQHRILQISVPIGCIIAYLLWTGSGLQQHAIRKLVLPVSTEGWLLILPYLLLLPMVLFGDRLQLWWHRRRSPPAAD